MPDKDFASLVEARAYTYGEAKGLRTAIALLRTDQSFFDAVLSHPAWAAILSNIAGKAKGLDVAAARMRCHCARPQHELCRCPHPVSEAGATKGSAVTGVTLIRSPSSLSIASSSSSSSSSSGSSSGSSSSSSSSSSGDSSSTARTHERSDGGARSDFSGDPQPGANGLIVKPVKVSKPKDGKGKGHKGKGKDHRGKGKGGKDGKDGQDGKDGRSTVIVLGPERRIPVDVPMHTGETVTVLGPERRVPVASAATANASVSAGVSVALQGSISAVGPSIAFKRGPDGEVGSVLGPNRPESATPKPARTPSHHTTFGVEGYAAGSVSFTRPRTGSVLSSISVDLEDLEPYVRLPGSNATRRSTLASVSSVASSPVAPKRPAIEPLVPDRTGTPVRSVPPTPSAGGFFPTLPALGFPSPGQIAYGASSVSSASHTSEGRKSPTAHVAPALPEVLGHLGVLGLPDQPQASAATAQASASTDAGMITEIIAQGVAVIQQHAGEKTDEKPVPEVVQGLGDYGPNYKPPGIPGSYVHPGYGIHPSPSGTPAALPPNPAPVVSTPPAAPAKPTPNPTGAAAAHPPVPTAAPNFSPLPVSRPPRDAPTLGNSPLALAGNLSPYSAALARPLPPSRPTSSASTVDDEPLDDVLARLTFEEQQYIASLFSGNEDPSRIHPVLSDQAVYVISSMSRGGFARRESVKEEIEEEAEAEKAEHHIPKETKHKDKKKRKTNTNRKPKKERAPIVHEVPAPAQVHAPAHAPVSAAPSASTASSSQVSFIEHTYPPKWAAPPFRAPATHQPPHSPPARAMTAGPGPSPYAHVHQPPPRANSTPPHSLPTPPQTAYPHVHPHPEPHTHRPGCACRRPSVTASVCSNHSTHSHHSHHSHNSHHSHHAHFGINGVTHASPRVAHAVVHACSHAHTGPNQLCSCTL